MRSLRSPEPTRLLRSSAWAWRREDSALCLSRAASSDIALARFLCWLRSSWHSTTTPLGRWVMRMAESVVLTCWPPAPLGRKVSTRRSAGDADARAGGVHVLRARNARAEGLDPHGGRMELYPTHPVRLGPPRHGTGAGVDPPLGLGGRHPLPAMGAGLELDPGIDPLAL